MPSTIFDGNEPYPQSTPIPLNSHVHANWALSQPGIYRLGVQMTATAKNEAGLTDTQTLALAIGDADPGQVPRGGSGSGSGSGSGTGSGGGGTGASGAGNSSGSGTGAGAGSGSGGGTSSGGGSSGSGTASGGSSSGGSSSGGNQAASLPQTGAGDLALLAGGGATLLVAAQTLRWGLRRRGSGR